jgi:hypothetical protein
VRLRLGLVLTAAFAFTVASCGVSRDVTSADGTTDTTDLVTSDSEVGGEDTGTTAPDTDPTVPETTASTAPPTTAPDDEVAASLVFDDGSEGEVLHGELNAVTGPTRDNIEFVTLVYGPEVPFGFEAVVLQQVLLARMLDHELARENVSATDEDRVEAKSLLTEQLVPLFPASADPAAEAERIYGEVPYLPFIVELQARQIALANQLKAAAPEAARNPCVSHILVSTEAEADEVLTQLQGGASFATLAIELSTDSASGAEGGELGCVPSSSYVAEFATAVDTAPLGQVVGPVQSQFGFHLLVVDRLEADGDALTQARLETGLAAATITVDDRIGTWDVESQRITPAGS